MRALLLLALFLPTVASADIIVIRRTPGGGGSCGSSTIATDTFTEASTGNIELNDHTKDSGGTWTDASPFTFVNIDRTNDVILSTTTNATIAVIDDAVGCNDYYAQLTARTGGTGTNRIGLVGRYNTATDQGYEFRLTGAGNVEIRRRDTGSQTSLATASVATVLGSFSAATDYTLRFDVYGSSGGLTGYINGVSAVTATDTTYLSGKPGVFITNTSPRGDNFSAVYRP